MVPGMDEPQTRVEPAGSTVQPIVVTADLPRLAAFYAAVAGAAEASRVPEEGAPFYVGLRVGGSDLGLVSDASAADAPAGKVLLSIDVPDVAALVDRVAAAGGRVTGGPNDMPWGQRVLHVQDPDGNAVNLTQRL
jgi:predicted enzyme related to lactoylglutathione lyase